MQAFVHPREIREAADRLAHRRFARMTIRDPGLLDAARWEAARHAEDCGQPYVAAWRDVLALPPEQARAAMVRDDAQGRWLRRWSPFPTSPAFVIRDPDLRRRMQDAAVRIATRRARRLILARPGASVAEAAFVLDLEEKAVQRMTDSGRLPSIGRGEARRIPTAALAALRYRRLARSAVAKAIARLGKAI